VCDVYGRHSGRVGIQGWLEERVSNTSSCGKEAWITIMVWVYWCQEFVDNMVEERHMSESLMVKLVIGECLIKYDHE